jgi:hypothetical protein
VLAVVLAAVRVPVFGQRGRRVVVACGALSGVLGLQNADLFGVNL